MHCVVLGLKEIYINLMEYNVMEKLDGVSVFQQIFVPIVFCITFTVSIILPVMLDFKIVTILNLIYENLI